MDCRVKGFYGCEIRRNFRVDNEVDDGQPRFRERGKLCFLPIRPVRIVLKQVNQHVAVDQSARRHGVIRARFARDMSALRLQSSRRKNAMI